MNLLITGTFRSSTTLLSRILNSSRNLQVFSDLTCYIRFHGFDIENKDDILDEILNRIHLRRGYGINLKARTHLNSTEYDKASDLWFDILNNLKERNDKEFCGEKIVLEWRRIEPFLLEKKENKVVHTIRDPRSVIVSWKKMTNSKPPKYFDALFNCIDSMNVALKLKQKFGEDRYQVFVYDEFIKYPNSYIKNICNNFGIEYSDGMLNSENWTLDGKKYNSSSVHGKIENFNKARSRSWKEYITVEEEYMFNKIFPDNLIHKFNFLQKRRVVLDHVNRKVIEEYYKNSLLYTGLIDWFFYNESQSRFPSDFRDPSTWMKPFYE